MAERSRRDRSAAVGTALVLVRRGALAFAVASIISGVVKLQAPDRTPARHGGWRELPVSELR